MPHFADPKTGSNLKGECVMSLNIDFNMGADSDDLFNGLLAHEGLSPSQSEQMNAALILLLMNHIGDAAVIRDAVDRARSSLDR